MEFSADIESLVTRFIHFMRRSVIMTHSTRILLSLLQPFTVYTKNSDSSNYPTEEKEGTSISFQYFHSLSSRYNQRTQEGWKRRELFVDAECNENTCNYGSWKLENIVMKFDIFVYAVFVEHFTSFTFVRFQLSSKWGWRLLSERLLWGDCEIR